jgi:hypothetical protein
LAQKLVAAKQEWPPPRYIKQAEQREPRVFQQLVLGRPELLSRASPQQAMPVSTSAWLRAPEMALVEHWQPV